MKKAIMILICLTMVIQGYTQGKDELIKWIDAKELGIEGRGWGNDSLYYTRLPAKAEGRVPDSVWNLSKKTAGLFLHFITDANTIKAKWGLTNEKLSAWENDANGVSGLDLYVKMEDKSWHWLAVGKPLKIENVQTLVEGMSEGRREYLLYLPLFNGIKYLEIGVPKGNILEKATPFMGKPIVFYGTSITQGEFASRPGMCTTAILSRRLNREIINLGFDGSGKMEPEIAELLAELDPAVYFIDCIPNLLPDEIAVRVDPFVRILRKSHPDTPIVLSEGTTYNDAFLVKSRQLRNVESRRALRKAYENLLNDGIKNLYYQIGEGQLGSDGEATVDGTHPTDLGFMRQANVYEFTLESILKQLQ